MKECEIEKAICKYAESKGILQFKFSSPSHKGVPDRIFIFNGGVFFIEFKGLNKKQTKLQEFTSKKIELQRVPVYVVDTIDKGVNIIDNMYLKVLNLK